VKSADVSAPSEDAAARRDFSAANLDGTVRALHHDGLR